MYSQALEIAVQAARRAGDLLLAEFCRPGGPRGSSAHAPVDGEAEALIAQDLLSRFSDWGFLGEERSDLRRGGDHIWVVDPNDGTRAYLEGWRGSAVSIALVHQGRPVLGVVYAFAVGEGDLFAWAEGCGPVVRNGRPVQARIWPERLSEQDVVLVSQHADHCPEFNARAVAPARFRAVPGIAWRLALVAAGEAVAAVSLSGPGDWDYAAGHALLRGAGADLYDEAASPVGYDAQGRSSLARCFGGPEAVARDLAGRSWTPGRRQDSKLCWPSRQRILTDPGVLSRAQGCLLGQVAGDSLGSLVEFQRPEQILRAYPEGPRELANGGTWNTLAGQPTDDSEMALALARSILASGGYSSGAAALAYGAWLRSGPFDVGNTTRQTLGGISAEASPEDAEATCGKAALQVARQGGQANGSLMRISPLGVFGHALKPEALACPRVAGGSTCDSCRVSQNRLSRPSKARSQHVARTMRCRRPTPPSIVGRSSFGTGFASIMPEDVPAWQGSSCILNPRPNATAGGGFRCMPTKRTRTPSGLDPGHREPVWMEATLRASGGGRR
jgi:fructose-1,6-bisphosphatase/inositol monophosphatase family enzyme